MGLYASGSLVRISATFSVNSVDTDPTTITLKVKNPAGTTSTYTYALAEITKAATGQYQKDVSAAASGEWWYRWEGTGAVQAAAEGNFRIEPSRF